MSGLKENKNNHITKSFSPREAFFRTVLNYNSLTQPQQALAKAPKLFNLTIIFTLRIHFKFPLFQVHFPLIES